MSKSTKSTKHGLSNKYLHPIYDLELSFVTKNI